jgi:hypothetical protein
VAIAYGNSHDQARLMDLLVEWEKNNAKIGYEITQDIRGLDSRLQRVQRNLVHVQNDDRWTKLYDHLSEVTVKVQQVSRTHTIIASLRYEYMELRHETIHDTYRTTFDWIYRSDSPIPDDPRSQIGFVKWLRHGTGVYWITGKPGKHMLNILASYDIRVTPLQAPESRP